jgi:hypothetical protein
MKNNIQHADPPHPFGLLRARAAMRQQRCRPA